FLYSHLCSQRDFPQASPPPPTNKKIFFFPTKTELHLSNAILPCKTAFLSHKHKNERYDEQTLIQEQITEKMSRLCWTTLRPRPLFNCLWTHTPPLQPVKCIRSSSQSPANNVFLVFCSVDGWQTTILEGLGQLWHILFTHFKLSIYLKVNKMSRNEKKKRNSPNVKRKTHFFF